MFDIGFSELLVIAVVALLVLAVAVLVPIVFEQLATLVNAVPGIAERLDARLPSLLEGLADRGLLPVARGERRQRQPLLGQPLLARRQCRQRLVGIGAKLPPLVEIGA